MLSLLLFSLFLSIFLSVFNKRVISVLVLVIYRYKRLILHLFYVPKYTKIQMNKRTDDVELGRKSMSRVKRTQLVKVRTHSVAVSCISMGLAAIPSLLSMGSQTINMTFTRQSCALNIKTWPDFRFDVIVGTLISLCPFCALEKCQT